MSSVLQWLGGKALNAILATSALALIGPVFAAVVVFLRCLRIGFVDALVVAGSGAALAALLSVPAAMVFNGIPAVPDLLENLSYWFAGAVLLALWQQRLGSLTLNVQSTLLLAVTLVFGLYLAEVAPEYYWATYLQSLQSSLEAAGMTQVDAFMATVVNPLAHAMGIASIWLGGVWITGIGTSLFNQLAPAASFGRFSDLNLGRVLAAIMVAACVILAVLPWQGVMAVALVLFLGFAVPGVALVHWIVQMRGHPPALALLVYVLLLVPLVNGFILMSLAVTGYIDAWFDIRSRIARSKV